MALLFTVNYDNTLIDSNSVKIDFTHCWLGKLDSNLIAIQKDLYHEGKIEAAIVRKDHQNITGFGTLGELSADMKDDVSGRNFIFKTLQLTFSNVRMVRNDEIELPVNLVNDSLVLFQDVTAIKNESAQNNTVNLFPNPAKDKVEISTNNTVGKIENISIYDVLGTQVYFNDKITNAKTTIDTKDFAAGIYLLKIKTEKEIVVKKLTITE